MSEQCSAGQEKSNARTHRVLASRACALGYWLTSIVPVMFGWIVQL